MPTYCAKLVIEVDGDDITWLHATLDEIREIVTIVASETNTTNQQEFPNE